MTVWVLQQPDSAVSTPPRLLLKERKKERKKRREKEKSTAKGYSHSFRIESNIRAMSLLETENSAI